jgi:hypothetical protein
MILTKSSPLCQRPVVDEQRAHVYAHESESISEEVEVDVAAADEIPKSLTSIQGGTPFLS